MKMHRTSAGKMEYSQWRAGKAFELDYSIVKMEHVYNMSLENEDSGKSKQGTKYLYYINPYSKNMNCEETNFYSMDLKWKEEAKERIMGLIEQHKATQSMNNNRENDDDDEKHIQIWFDFVEKRRLGGKLEKRRLGENLVKMPTADAVEEEISVGDNVEVHERNLYKEYLQRKRKEKSRPIELKQIFDWDFESNFDSSKSRSSSLEREAKRPKLDKVVRDKIKSPVKRGPSTPQGSEPTSDMEISPATPRLDSMSDVNEIPVAETRRSWNVSGLVANPYASFQDGACYLSSKYESPINFNNLVFVNSDDGRTNSSPEDRLSNESKSHKRGREEEKRKSEDESTWPEEDAEDHIPPLMSLKTRDPRLGNRRNEEPEPVLDINVSDNGRASVADDVEPPIRIKAEPTDEAENEWEDVAIKSERMDGDYERNGVGNAVRVKPERPDEENEDAIHFANDSNAFDLLGGINDGSTNIYADFLGPISYQIGTRPRLIFDGVSSGKIIRVDADSEAVISAEWNDEPVEILFNVVDFITKTKKRLTKEDSLKSAIQPGQTVSFHGGRLIQETNVSALYESKLVYEGSKYPSLATRFGGDVKKSFPISYMYDRPLRAKVLALLLPFHAVIEIENPSPRLRKQLAAISNEVLYECRTARNSITGWVDELLAVGDEITVALQFVDRGKEHARVRKAWKEAPRSFERTEAEIPKPDMMDPSTNSDVRFVFTDDRVGTVYEVQQKGGIFFFRYKGRNYEVNFDDFYVDGRRAKEPFTDSLLMGDEIRFKCFNYSEEIQNWYSPYIWKGRQPTWSEIFQKFFALNNPAAVTNDSSVYSAFVHKLLPYHAILRVELGKSFVFATLAKNDVTDNKANNVWMDSMFKKGEKLKVRISRQSNVRYSATLYSKK